MDNFTFTDGLCFFFLIVLPMAWAARCSYKAIMKDWKDLVPKSNIKRVLVQVHPSYLRTAVEEVERIRKQYPNAYITIYPSESLKTYEVKVR